MHRNNDNKLSSQNSSFVTNPASANVIENLNATSSNAGQNPSAKAMRSGQQHDVAYEVAGPTVGGGAPNVSPYNPDSLIDSMSKAKISEGTSATATTATTTKPVGASLTDSVLNAGAKAAEAVGAVNAGAAAAGSNLINAAKNVVSHHDAPADTMESPHPHPIADMSGKIANMKSQTTTTSTPYSPPKRVDIEPIHSTGLNNPVRHTTHHHTTHNIPQGEVATAGVIGASSATMAAPPLNDTIRAAPGHTPSEPSSYLPLHDPSHPPSNDGVAKKAASDEKHLQEHRSSIKEKVKNVFHRRPSAQAAAEAEAAAAAAEAAKPKSYDTMLDRFEAIPETPYTSSGAPKADLHAAPGKPAVKLDAHPTTTLNQGHNARRQEGMSDLPMSKTSTTSSSSTGSSRPLSERMAAPVVGAASAVGAAAAGTAAYMSNKTTDAKDAVADSTNTSIYSNRSVPPTPYSTPVVNTPSSYSASSTTMPTVERTTLKTTAMEPSRFLTEKIAAPAVGTAAYIGTKAMGAKDAAVDTANNLTHSNKPAAHTTTTYSTSGNTYNAPTTQKTTSTTSESSRPLAESTTAQGLGATSAIGASQGGTQTYVEHKAMHTSDTVADTAGNLTHGNQPTTTTSYTTPAAVYSTPAADKTNVTASTTTTTAAAPSRPLTDKITAPVTSAAATAGAAAAGTAAYMANKAKDTKDTMTGTGNAYDSSSYTATSSTAPALSSHAAHTTTTGAAPAPAPTVYSKTTPTTASSFGATPMPAIPSSYKGPIPKAGPGEEVVWVKTTTTTEYYDTEKGLDPNGDVVESHQNVLDPNTLQTEHDNVTTYVSDGHGGKRLQK